MEKTYFRIKDLAHGKYLRCGENYDGKLYHGDKTASGSSEWAFVKVDDTGTIKPDDGEKYYIMSKLHQMYLVAGQKYDGKVYLQEDNTNLAAQWTLEPGQIKNASGWKIVDVRHGKCLVSGQVYDGKVYHQDFDSCEKNTPGLWVFEYVSGPKEDIPDFMILASAKIESFHIDYDALVKVARPDFIIEQDCENELDVDQTRTIERTEEFESEWSMTTEESVSSYLMEEVYAKAAIKFSLGSKSKGEADKTTTKGFEFSTEGGYSKKWGKEVETKKTNSCQMRYKTTVTIKLPLVIPKHSNFNAQFTISQNQVSVPFEAKVTYLDLDGKEKIKVIKGKLSDIQYFGGGYKLLNKTERK